MKINKETQAENDTLNKMNLLDIYRTFHSKTIEYTFFLVQMDRSEARPQNKPQ